ncbi:alpha-L-fucosidase [Gracilibacillus alcaliphilus]|uniref:alpha-L-fucosidase n=1 Tax=Gracilibacillus alcaliphilus TaxID=1401441 RepID=UPI00195EF28A|nr:alpha-L-fucosidase [Gracilibacillus alcaliphilus]MBM7677465.1 alpha-L-fucosidase [Gracilibacillus alcaliphilus]
MSHQTKAKVKPTARQLEYQDWEYGLFLHFGLRTFYEGYHDFDERTMSPTAFQPAELDCEQWIRKAKEANMTYAVLTAKHHDGFSNWPSAYTDFSVKNSPWKDGKGDVVKEFIEACRKYDLKTGLYYSPYDGSVDFYNKDAKEYDDYFINQITELLTNYGEIDILWFDGAGSEDHQYDWPRIVKQIRSLQPNILIFNMVDPNFRWVGNEDGLAPNPTWNAVESTEFSIYTEKQSSLQELQWLPAECDVQLRNTWFYSENNQDQIKSVEELIGLYYHSVGNGANLLLNIGPDRQGKLPVEDVERILEFKEALEKRFSRPLASFDNFKQEGNKWIYQADQSVFFDHVVIEEDLTDGENIRQFQIAIKTKKSGVWCPIYQDQHVGHKRIIAIPPVMAKEVIVEVTASDDKPILKNLSIYHVGLYHS